jgi:hypothetical protein
LLKQQSSITVCCLLTKENKLPSSVTVCSKQTEVGRFHLPFATNKWKLPFSISAGCSVCIYMLRFKRKMETQANFS